jgi:hypothetical protein
VRICEPVVCVQETKRSTTRPFLCVERRSAPGAAPEWPRKHSGGACFAAHSNLACESTDEKRRLGVRNSRAERALASGVGHGDCLGPARHLRAGEVDDAEALECLHDDERRVDLAGAHREVRRLGELVVVVLKELPPSRLPSLRDVRLGHRLPRLDQEDDVQTTRGRGSDGGCSLGGEDAAPS